MTSFAISSQRAKLVNLDGTPTPEFYRFLSRIQDAIGDGAVALLQESPVVTYLASETYVNDRVLTQGAGLSFVSAVGTFTISLATSGATAASYGSASKVAQITVDQYGRVTSASEVAITLSGIGAASSSTTLTAGAGMTGGGDLSANRTFDIGAGTGITVNANDVAIDPTVVVTLTGSQTLTNKTLTAPAITGGSMDDTAIGQTTRDVGYFTYLGANAGFQLPSYTVATTPIGAPAGSMIHVSDESGGAVPAFYDGTNWRRVTDRNVVS